MVDYHWFLASSGCDGRNVPVSRLLVKRRVAGLQFACVDVLGCWDEGVCSHACLFLVGGRARHQSIVLGYVVKAKVNFDGSGQAISRLTLVCPLYFLTQQFSESVLLGGTIKYFMVKFLDRAELKSLTVKWLGGADKAHIDQFIQAENESDYNFFCRALSFSGLSYVLLMGEQMELQIFPVKYLLQGKKIKIEVKDSSGMVAGEEDNYCNYLTRVYQQPLEHISLIDHSEDFSDKWLQLGRGDESSIWSARYYGMGRRNKQELKNFLITIKARCNILHNYALIKTPCLSIRPGDVVSLYGADGLSGSYKDHSVFSVNYSFCLASQKLEGRVVLLPEKTMTPIYINLKKTEGHQQSLIKKIGKKNSLCIDDSGNYYVLWKNNVALLRVPRSLYFVGPKLKEQASTWHYPFVDKQKIIISFINGQPNRPVIVAGLVDGDSCLLMAADKTKHSLTINNDSLLSFNDNPVKSGVGLSNKTLGIGVFLSDVKKESVSVDSALGDIKVNAKNIFYEAKKEFMSLCYKSSGYDVESFVAESKNNTFIQSKNKISMTSGGDFCVTSKKDIHMNSNKNIINTAKDIAISGDAMFVDARRFDVKSVGSISVCSGNSLVFSTGSSAVELHASGLINCYGVLLRSGLASFSGAKLKHYYPGAPFADQFFLKKWVEKLADEVDPVFSFNIDGLTWSKDKALCGDNVDCQFVVKAIDKKRKIKVFISFCKGEKVSKVVEIAGVVLDEVGVVKVPWTISIPCACFNEGGINSDCCLRFDISVEGKKVNKLSAKLFLLVNLQFNVGFFVNKIHRDIPAQLIASLYDDIKSTNDSLPAIIEGESVVVVDGKAFYDRILWRNNDVLIRLVQQNNVLEIIDKNDGQPNYQQFNNVLQHNPNKIIQQKVNLMPPFILCNMREDADSSHCCTRSNLTEEELGYCHQYNNSAIVFIHGFNVDYGFFGKHFKGINLIDLSSFDLTQESLVSSKLSAELSQYETYSYRDTNWLIKRFPVFSEAKSCNLDKWLDQQWYLNGKGAHNWFINMEYNLNHANGFTKNNYQQYRRIIHVAWSGDVSCAVNYPHAAMHAKMASKKLAELIKQLKNAQLKTSIVAHSLGCAVVLMAMQHLADNDFHEQIDCVALWEAAVPSDVFFPISHNKVVSPLYLWHLPQAVTMAKKFVVLTCKNDNVLGPIPQKKANGLSYEQWLAHKPFWQEWLPAVIVQELGLKSIYAAATWMGVSITDLFDTNQQKDIYEQWVKLHPLDKNKKELPKQFYDFLQADMQINHHEHEKLTHQFLINQDLLQDFVSRYGQDNFDLAPGFFIRWFATGMEKSENLLFDFDKVLSSVRGALALAHLMFKHVGYEPLLALGYEGPLMNSHIKAMLKNKKLILINQDDCLFSHSGMKVPSKDLQEKVYNRLIKELPGFVDD